MSFLSPFTLTALGLLALPVLIHMLARRRARRLDFPSLRFLRETPSFRLRPRRVRQPLLLALRVAALGLLVLGFARPFVSSNSRAQHTRIILLDASLSMSARGRADAAREQARAIIDKLPADERAGIIAFASESKRLVEATTDHRELAQALEVYQPTSGAADYGKALSEADALLLRESQGTAEIDVISDFQQSNLEGEFQSRGLEPQGIFVSHAGARIQTFAVGAEVERNAFLTGESAVNDESGIELSGIESISDGEGQSGARREWTIDASAGAHGGIVWRTETNGQITGRIETLAPDDFDGDDARFFAFTAPRRARALLFETNAESSLYLGAALEAAAGDESRAHLTVEHGRELPERADALKDFSLVVYTLHGAPHAAEMHVLADYARAGGNLWLLVGRDADTSQWNAFASTDDGRAFPFVSLTRAHEGQTLGLVPTDAGASVLRSMDESALLAFSLVSVIEGCAVVPRDEAATLMRWSDGSPSFVSMKTGDGSVLMLATSTERAAGKLGLSASFPALVAAIFHQAVQPREPLSREVGEPIRLGVEPSTMVRVTDQQGRAVSTEARELVQHPSSIFREIGIYRLEYAGRASYLAVNAPAAESARALSSMGEIRRDFPEGSSLEATKASAWRESAERNGNAWRVFLVACFILLLAELFVSMRPRQDEV